MVHLHEQMNQHVLELQAAKEEWSKEKEALLGKLDAQQRYFTAKLDEEMTHGENIKKKLETYAQEQESHEQEKEELLLQMIGLESQLKVLEYSTCWVLWLHFWEKGEGKMG